MKSVIVIVDGMSDEPLASLGGETPLGAANVPTLDYLAGHGRVGQFSTTFPGYPIESMVCIMGLLGYPPAQFYPGGRASFEALARGVAVSPSEIALRCNIVGLDDAGVHLRDFTSGMIDDSHARQLLELAEVPDPRWRLVAGQSYRNLLIVPSDGASASAIRCAEPHMHHGEEISSLLPHSVDAASEALAAKLRKFLLASQRTFTRHGRGIWPHADMLWVWSPSTWLEWPSLLSRTGLRAAMIGGLDFLGGIAMAASIHFEPVPGATGYIDTDYDAKARRAAEYLTEYDVVIVHVNAADEAGHQRDPLAKKSAIEAVDARIVKPLLAALRRTSPSRFNLLVCADHTTRCSDGRHTDALTPFLLFGPDVIPNGATEFSERECSRYDAQSSLVMLSLVR